MLEYSQFDAMYNWESGMNIREEAVRFSMSELARENVRPDIDLNAELPLIEAELVPMVSLYRGEWAAEEAKRLFIQASLA